jgi:hypothetical protein
MVRDAHPEIISRAPPEEVRREGERRRGGLGVNTCRGAWHRNDGDGDVEAAQVGVRGGLVAARRQPSSSAAWAGAGLGRPGGVPSPSGTRSWCYKRSCIRVRLP